ncbi:uncharacterized protein LOC135377314 isoform X1 [Ornithodoros turicata]|uniref:uncharacterized protein LOC135377314 isoform X1 n=1 Tax=Ornithodoros turicata TaxID=34597 RepID=UPI003138AC53
MRPPETLSRLPLTNGIDSTCDRLGVMSGGKLPEPPIVAGIQYFGNAHAAIKNQGMVLGVVVLESNSLSTDELRRVMCDQLPSLPAHFAFLTKERWPVQKSQEHLIKTSHLLSDDGVINITRYHEKPRVAVLSTGGSTLGSVFCDYNAVLRQFREVIAEQLHDLKRGSSLPDFRFVEGNGCPITTRQEAALTVLDVLDQGRSLFVLPGAAPTGESSTPSTSSIIPTNMSQRPRPHLPIMPSEEWDGKRKKSVRFSRHEPKPILISYVRAEAAQHALDLKKELLKMNFSVYLDIDEIKTGSDWQDALNYAVSECHLFVPLISRMYGKTQWTNREVKLADVLHKVITPVNFLDTWPPECLAIQFASTQYIPAWKPTEHDTIQGGDLYKNDHRVSWDESNLRRVAREIAERYRQTTKKEQVATKQLGLKKSSSLKNKRNSHLTTLTEEVPMANVMEMPVLNQYPELREFLGHQRVIVISAHPRQKEVAQAIAGFLNKEGYTVWSTTELSETRDSYSDADGTHPNTPRDAAPLPKSDRVFDGSRDFNTRVTEYRRSTQHDTHDGHPSVCRLPSQMSDVSVASVLGGEKLERVKRFQQMAVRANVVVVLISKEYINSKTSQQQVFYCEHRKHVVLVQCDDYPIPCWFSSLMGNDIIKRNSCEFESALKVRVRRATNPDSSETPKDAATEATIQCLVTFMKKEIPALETCVYIAGGSKLPQRSEEICREIGKELAKLPNVAVITGGFYGAPDIVARTFHEARENNGETDTKVFHILPCRDEKVGERGHPKVQLSTHFLSRNTWARHRKTATAPSRLFRTARTCSWAVR